MRAASSQNTGGASVSAAWPPGELLDQLLDRLERRLRKRLNALGPAPRAELLHVLMLPDFDRADAIGSYWGNLKTEVLDELLRPMGTQGYPCPRAQVPLSPHETWTPHPGSHHGHGAQPGPSRRV